MKGLQTSQTRPAYWSGPSGVGRAFKAVPWARTVSTQTVRQQSACVPTPQATALPGPQNVGSLRSQLQLFNTMGRRKEPFMCRQDTPDTVSMYVCGVTAYDYSHIGHARVYIAFDVLYRLLSHGLQYNVQYVRNFTDIDDKIIARAAQCGQEPLALSARFIDEFHKDMRALGCLPPTSEPRASEFIPQMIQTIQRIIANGHAYAVEGGDVYFDVQSLPSYGKLSGRAQEDNRAGERVAVDGRKRSPADFALWKSAKPGEISWPSPWGQGRPGWHIECSAMIEHLMGPVIDIHGGGRDLVFPHHENELAQAQGASGCCSHAHGCSHQVRLEGSHESGPSSDFVRLWMHNGFVNVDSEKMSKSLGNFFTIREVLSRYHPLALRWFLLSTHYRQPVSFSHRALEEASSRVYYIFQALADVHEALEAAGAAGEAAAKQAADEQAAGTGSSADVVSSALHALVDDLNTPGAVSTLSAPLKSINDLLTTKAGRRQPNRLLLLGHYQRALTGVLQMLGMLPFSDAETHAAISASGSSEERQQEVGSHASCSASGPGSDPSQVVLQELKRLALVREGLTEADVEACLAQRAQARASKNFARADALRKELADKGIAIMDTPQGTAWRPVQVQ